MVKRYDPDDDVDHYEVHDGEWVMFADYQALESKLQAEVTGAQYLQNRVEELGGRLAAARKSLLSIRNTPPLELDGIDGKSEHWWYRLVKDLRDQAAEAYSAAIVERVRGCPNGCGMPAGHEEPCFVVERRAPIGLS